MLKRCKECISNLWWLFVISSIVSIIFGVITLFIPELTLVTLVVMFAVFVLIHGIAGVMHGFSIMHKDKSWWVEVLLGLLLLVAGIYLTKNPTLSVVVFITIIGWVLMGFGILETIIGLLIPFKKSRWILSGVLGIISGIIIWNYPISGTLAFTWILGLYALLNGILVLSGALTIRTAYKKVIKKR